MKIVSQLLEVFDQAVAIHPRQTGSGKDEIPRIEIMQYWKVRQIKGLQALLYEWVLPFQLMAALQWR